MSEREVKAFIYCRTASVSNGSCPDAIAEQDARCRNYAREKNYELAGIFHEVGVAGTHTARPGFKAMLDCLKRQQPARCVVVVDDINRLGRGISSTTLALRAIDRAGGVIDSPSLPLPTG